jgi:hypothetical protein
MLENSTPTEPTVALTRDVLDRIEFGDPRVDGYDYQDDPSDGGRINAAVPILLDGRQIGTAKTGAWVYTSDAPDTDTSKKIRQFGYAIVPYRGGDQYVDWAIAVAESEDEAEPPLERAEKQLLQAAQSEMDFEAALAADLRNRANVPVEETSLSKIFEALRTSK